MLAKVETMMPAGISKRDGDVKVHLQRRKGLEDVLSCEVGLQQVNAGSKVNLAPVYVEVAESWVSFAFGFHIFLVS